MADDEYTAPGPLLDKDRVAKHVKIIKITNIVVG